MQQCRFVYTITRADCRACNGLNGDRGIGAGRMRGMVLRTGRRMEAGGRCVCGAEWQLRAPCVGDGEPGKGFGRI